jgi:hypothetical protein
MTRGMVGEAKQKLGNRTAEIGAKMSRSEVGAMVQSARMSAPADKSGDSPTPLNQNLPKPYFKPDGTLVIPMAGDPKYHWWKNGGQSVYQTREELMGTQE